jgi:hypothetical protein
MTISDQARYELHGRLEEVLGVEHASALMALLPPVGWADVATKHDLAALEDRIDLRFAAIDLRFAAIDQRFDAIDQRFDATDQRLDDRLSRTEMAIRLDLHQTLVTHLRVIMFGMISAMIAFAAVVIAAVKL